MKTFPRMPAPPLTTSDPVEVLVDIVVAVAKTFPPAYTFPVIPAPPVTFRAPVPVVIETAPLPIAISPVVVNAMDCDRCVPAIVLLTILFP